MRCPVARLRGDIEHCAKGDMLAAKAPRDFPRDRIADAGRDDRCTNCQAAIRQDQLRPVDHSPDLRLGTPSCQFRPRLIVGILGIASYHACQSCP